VLCGLTVDHELGLAGHSDADVATHAVIDAVLGAAGLPDIGALFPDSDPAYEGVSSIALLRDVVARAHAAGWRVGNVDLVIVAQRPRLAAYRERMRALLAEALEVGPDAVGVKATTTEGMGFEGRAEGVSATAVCLLEGD
jgi:2-C-methyl-D-erythritol 2,4-cyclodiphosphate synthase